MTIEELKKALKIECYVDAGDNSNVVNISLWLNDEKISSCYFHTTKESTGV